MRIIGVGSYLPERILKNQEIESFVDTTDEWITSKLGIRERRVALESQSASDLAYRSSVAALEDANVKSDQIDLIIVATSTPDRLSPSTACILQELLEAKKAAAFDINAVCSGFVYGLSIANAFMKAGVYNRILLVASEVYSKITDWESKECVFFGDGSGAVILERDDDNLFDCTIHADGTGKDNFTVMAGGSFLPASTETIKLKQHYFKMDGKAVYRTGIQVLPETILTLIKKNGIDIKDVDHLIPHQPSIRILEETARIINFSFDKVGKSMDIYANTAGASIPVTLDLLYKQKKLNFNDILVFAAVGSGWTWGSAIIRWSKKC